VSGSITCHSSLVKVQRPAGATAQRASVSHCRSGCQLRRRGGARRPEAPADPRGSRTRAHIVRGGPPTVNGAGRRGGPGPRGRRQSGRRLASASDRARLDQQHERGSGQPGEQRQRQRG
jgi:hypothetical protein